MPTGKTPSYRVARSALASASRGHVRFSSPLTTRAASRTKATVSAAWATCSIPINASVASGISTTMAASTRERAVRLSDGASRSSPRPMTASNATMPAALSTSGKSRWLPKSRIAPARSHGHTTDDEDAENA